MLISIKNLFRNKKYNVNPSVRLTFNSKFPKAKNILWKQIDVFKWQVNFTVKKEKFSALFNSDGKWLETVSLVHLDKIPKPVQLTFKRKYEKHGLQQIYYVQTPDRSLYEMKLYNGIYALKLVYDCSGKIVGKLIV